MTGIMIAAAGVVEAVASGGGGPGPGPPGPGSPLAVDANASLTQGEFNDFFMVNCSPPITLTPLGGTPPYALAWSLISGSPFEVVAGSGPPWTTVFQFNSPSHFESVYRATVTDNAGASVTFDVDVIANPFV